MSQFDFEPPRPAAQPAFNLPPVIVWLGGIIVAIFILQNTVLPTTWNNWIIIHFAFWPVRYEPGLFATGLAPGGLAVDIWSFVTYAFLHGGIGHLAFNMLWMAIFGSAVARRFGTLRFLLLSVLCAIGGAVAHLLTHPGETAPMIGASAAISGHMAAALRFVFELGGPLGAIRRSDQAAYHVPAAPLMASLANRQVAGFMAV